MKFLSILDENEIVDQIPTELTNEQVINLDGLLRRNGLLPENYEIAITRPKIDQSKGETTVERMVNLATHTLDRQNEEMRKLQLRLADTLT